MVALERVQIGVRRGSEAGPKRVQNGSGGGKVGELDQGRAQRPTREETPTWGRMRMDPPVSIPGGACGPCAAVAARRIARARALLLRSLPQQGYDEQSKSKRPPQGGTSGKRSSTTERINTRLLILCGDGSGVSAFGRCCSAGSERGDVSGVAGFPGSTSGAGFGDTLASRALGAAALRAARAATSWASRYSPAFASRRG